MHKFRIGPLEIFLSLWRNWTLISTLTKREVIGRYRGSILGVLWSFFNPLLMLVVYTFVFSVVFKARWSGASESKAEFALVLFSGLIVFNIFSECIARAPSLLINNANYVKKVVFPLEILPFSTIGAALFHGLTSYLVWTVFYCVFIGVPHATVIVAPFLMFPFISLVLGLSWMLMSLGVYLKDINHVIGMLLTLFMFLSPIFYPVSALPEDYQRLMLLNPISPTIELFRDALMWGKLPPLRSYLLQLLFGLSVCQIGFVWFQKTRRGFADVL